MTALSGVLVVDLTRLLPGAFASRELLRLGARVVRVEAPGGDGLRHVDPGWHDALNGGKESVAVDLRADPRLAVELCRAADVVLEGFRPGAASRLGLEAGERTVWVAVTGFGPDGRHAQRAGHDLNYLGWAGVLAESVPPVTVADFAGAYAAVREALAGLLERGHTGRGSRREVSMTHESHALAVPGILRGEAACYRLYRTADHRLLTVAALEPKFWERLCELVGLPGLRDRAYESRLPELEARLAERPLADWLALFDGADVCAGPVSSHEEAALEFAASPAARAARVGEHTDAWLRKLGLS